MESILSLVVNAENVRTLATLAFVSCAYVLIRSQMKEMGYSLNSRIDGVESSINKRIDGVEISIKELKHNDMGHLNSTIEALTYALEKNGSLKQEDKAYVDSRLAH